MDTKQILASNKPLLGVYALALVPLPLYFVLVAPKKGDPDSPRAVAAGENEKTSYGGAVRKLAGYQSKIDSLSKRIKNQDAEQPVYTKDHIEFFKRRREAYQAQVGEMQRFLWELDQKLERWFPEFQEKVQPGKEPDRNDYTTHYTNNAIPKLRDRFADLVNTPAGLMLFDTPPPANQLRTYQKRYWIQEACLDALKTAGAGPLLARFEFPVEVATEGKPYKLIPARFSFTCSFRNVAKVVRELVAREIPMRVTQLEVEKTDFGGPGSPYDQPAIKLQVPRDIVFRQDAYTGQLDDAADFKGEERLEEYLPEPPVKVSITVEVLDFDVTEPAPPPPPEGEGEGEGEDTEGEGK